MTPSFLSSHVTSLPIHLKRTSKHHRSFLVHTPELTKAVIPDGAHDIQLPIRSPSRFTSRRCARNSLKSLVFSLSPRDDTSVNLPLLIFRPIVEKLHFRGSSSHPIARLRLPTPLVTVHGKCVCEKKTLKFCAYPIRDFWSFLPEVGGAYNRPSVYCALLNSASGQTKMATSCVTGRQPFRRLEHETPRHGVGVHMQIANECGVSWDG